MKVKLYVEGGGDQGFLRTLCRKGFRELLAKTSLRDRMPSITACGSRKSAFDDFCIAVKNATEGTFPMLLVVSEVQVQSGTTAWQHRADRDHWQKPNGVEDDQAQLMVQCMETWIVADRGAVQAFFGQGFRQNALPPVVDLENRARADIHRSLAAATKGCGSDRPYAKGARSFALLGKLDPNKLEEHLVWFKRFIQTLIERCGPL